VLLVGTTFRSQAETILVTAKVSAPPLTRPAIITSPHDQQHVQTATQEVVGTCPDQSYVRLYLNGSEVGAAQCESGSFHIQATLAPGANTLQARVFNLTDDEGPASSPITVYYDVPVPPTAGQPRVVPSSAGTSTSHGGVGQPSSGVSPLLVKVEYRPETHFVYESWTWTATIHGGTRPYKVRIDWGDGRTTQLDRSVEGPFTISHAYQTAGSYQPLVTATDSGSQAATYQLSAVVKPRPSVTHATFIDELQHYLWVVWPVYAAILLMAISFWLGELEVIRRFRESRRRRARRSRQRIR